MHTTDVPLSPEGRLREIAAMLAAGFLRLKCRPARPPAPPHAEMSPPGPPAAAPRAARRPRQKPPEFSRNGVEVVLRPRPDPSVVSGYRERKIGGSSMGLDVTKEVVALRRMTVPDPRRRYRKKEYRTAMVTANRAARNR